MADENPNPPVIENAPPPGEGAPPPPAKPSGFLDAQRAMRLKWAVKSGTFKDGTPVTDDDRAWYAAWETAHPPKVKEAAAPKGGKAPKLAIVPDADYDVPPGPDPKVPPPPRADPDPKAKRGRPPREHSGPKWQDKYKIEFQKPDGTKFTADEAREVLCIQGASVWAGITKAAEDGLALIGAKPYLKVSTDQIFPAMVLTLDKVLPDINLTPEVIALAGTACICLPAAIKFKKIREARKADAQKSDADKRRDDLRRRTEEVERKAREEEERQRRDAELQRTHAAATEPKVAPPPQQTATHDDAVPPPAPPPPSDVPVVERARPPQLADVVMPDDHKAALERAGLKPGDFT